MIKTIIFDLDGTIADSFSLAIDCIKELAEEENKKLHIKNFHSLKAKGPLQVIREDFKIPLIILTSL